MWAGVSTLEDAINLVSLEDTRVTVSTAPPLRQGRSKGAAAAFASVSGSDPKLKVLTSAPLPPNPGEIVNSKQLGRILETLKADSDYVLVDAPPMFAVGDAAAMAAGVDGIIVILRLDETTADTVASVEEFLTRVPTRALGIVVTGVPRGSKGRYRYDDPTSESRRRYHRASQSSGHQAAEDAAGGADIIAADAERERRRRGEQAGEDIELPMTCGSESETHERPIVVVRVELESELIQITEPLRRHIVGFGEDSRVTGQQIHECRDRKWSARHIEPLCRPPIRGREAR